MKKFAGLLFMVLTVQLSFGQTITTAQAGAWNATATWTGGVIPTSANSTAINVNHNVNIPSGYTATVDQVTVAVGITLTVDGGGILDLQSSGGTDLTLTEDFIILFQGANLVVNGTFTNNSLTALSLGAGLSTTSFNAGSIYTHAVNGLALPSSGTTWNATSTCNITGVTNGVPANLNQTFGNLTWNNSGHTGNLSLGLTSATINGDLTISNTNSPGIVTLAGSAGTVDINGDFIVSGSSRFLGTINSNVTLDVEGDFNFSSTGALSLLISNTGTIDFDLAGDFIVSSGTLNAYAVNSATTNLTFDGSVAQTFNTTGGTLVTTQGYNYTISNGAIVDAGTSPFVGTGTFTVGATGTLRVGSTDSGGAIQTGTANGNIRVSGTRTYNGGTTIVYNGAAAQSLGNGIPSDINLTIDNSSGVSLSTSTTISTGRTLALTSGNLSIGANTLTIDGSVSGSGTLSGGGSSDLTIAGSGNLSVGFTSGSREINDLNITRNGAVTLTSDLLTNGTGTLTLSNVSTLDFSDQSLTIDGIFSTTSGAFNNNSGSSLIIGGSAGAFSAASFNSANLGTLTLNRSGLDLSTASSLTIGTALNLTTGILSGAGAVTMGTGSTLTRTGNATYSKASPAATTTYNVVYSGVGLTTGNELTTDAGDLNNLTISSSGTVTLNSGITVNGALTLSGGSFAAGSNAIDMKGNFISGAASTLTSSAVTFSGTTTISGGITPTFNNITITGTLTPSANFNINGNLVNNGTLNAGSATTTFGGTTAITGSSTSSFNNIAISGSSSLTAPSGTMNIAGTFTNSGTFTHNSGTVNFNGTTTFSGTTPTFSGFTIAGSSTVTAPATLSIAGDFANSGTFTTTGSTITFNGPTGQEISGGSSTTSFENLTVNTTGTFNVDDNVNLTGTLAIGNTTTLDADGDGTGVFTLISNASGTARVDDLSGGGNVIGNVTFQRYFDGGGDVWRNFGVAVNGATVSNITAAGLTINGNDLAYYDETETALGTVNDGWVLQSTFGSSILNTRGYSMWTRTEEITTTIGFTGTLNTGNQTPTVAYTSTGSPTDDGWNLINNPFASTVDFDLFTTSGFDGTVYVWNTASSTYDSWNGTTGNLTNGLISSGQAFYLHATSSPSLTIQESDKVTTSTSFLRQEGLSNHLMISLVQNDKRDKTYIHFREDATDGLDGRFDGLKLSNGIFNLSSFATSGENLTINSMGSLSCTKVVSLNIENINSGSYHLIFDDLATFGENTSIELIDHYTGNAISLEQGVDYSFEVTSDETSFGSSRFELIFTQPYTEFAQAEGGSSCGKGEVVLQASGAPEGGIYRWYETIDASEPLVGENSSTLVLDELENTSIYYVSLVNSDGCESSIRVPVEGTVAEFPEIPEVSIDGLQLVSSSKFGNQWYKDGEIIDGAIETIYEVTESGEYSVIVENESGCTSVSEAIVMTITSTDIDDLKGDDDVLIYPNPIYGNEDLTVESSGLIKYHSIFVYDMSGKLMSTKKIVSAGKIQIDMSGFKKGIYFIHLIGETNSTVHKILKN